MFQVLALCMMAIYSLSLVYVPGFGTVYDGYILSKVYVPGFGTVYDGYMPPEESFLPASPRELRASGDVMSGPVIVGFNHDEGSLYMPGSKNIHDLALKQCKFLKNKTNDIYLKDQEESFVLLFN